LISFEAYTSTSKTHNFHYQALSTKATNKFFSVQSAAYKAEIGFKESGKYNETNPF
jgi:hypothetical protein